MTRFDFEEDLAGDPGQEVGVGRACMVFLRVFGFHLPLLFRVEEDEN